MIRTKENMITSPDATARQKIKIAQLCMALKIREPIEERPMSKGQAGLMIRKLLVEVNHGTYTNALEVARGGLSG